MTMATMKLKLIVLLAASAAAAVCGSAATAEYGERAVEVQVDDSAKNDPVCRAAFASNPIWDEISFAVHRNGETEHCASAPSSTDLLRKALSLHSCQEDALNKHQVESFLTEFLASSMLVAGCGPVPHSQANDQPKEEEIPQGSLLDFCDMGPDHTVIQKDHASLVPVSSGTLPCRFYTREGVRITSIQQLAELAANTTATTSPEATQECVVGADGAEDCSTTTTTSDSGVVHLYAVPAGRMFMFAPSFVGEKFVLDHVRDKDGNIVTLEVLSLKPRVFDIHNFFNLEESNELMEKALAETSETHRFHRSTTGTTGHSVFNKRTSENAWDTHGKTALMVKKRCFSLLGIDEYQEPMADGLQILRYNMTKAYTSHMDYLDNPASESYDYDSGGKGANRFATILLYFTDLGEHDGGETVFPRAWPADQSEEEHVEFAEGLKQLRESGDAAMLEPDSWEETMTVQCRTHLSVRPKAARAVLFYSQYPNGKSDPFSYHGGCPVLGGTKLAANLWTWSGIRPEYEGAPRKFEEQDKPKPSNAEQIHATFRNTKKDPQFNGAELYYDESGFFGKLDDGPVYVNTFAGHKWNIKVDGKTLKSFTIAPGESQQVFEV